MTYEQTRRAKPPQRNRAIHVYLMFLKSIFNKIRYDLAAEIVVAICSIVLGGLFVYIFSDFINIKIGSLSTEMRITLSKWASAGILATAVAMTIRIFRSYHSRVHDFPQLMLRMGEQQGVVKTFSILRYITVITAIFSVAWGIIYEYFFIWPLEQFLAQQLLLGLW